MQFKFNDFQFDSETLLLTQDGNVVAIRHMEAQVLALFLVRSDTVLNKDEILSHVWADKCVSEQVVFQCISNLRHVIGSDAIKTYPKRGYQWQLKLEQYHPIDAAERNSTQHDLCQANSKTLGHFKRLGSAVSVIILGLFIYLLSPFLDKDGGITSPQVKQIRYLPFDGIETLEDTSRLHFILDENEQIQSLRLESKDKHVVNLSGKLREFDGIFYLMIEVQGSVNHWKAHFSGNSLAEVKSEMYAHLSHEVIYDLVQHSMTKEIRLAKLAIAHQNAPNDLVILRQLSLSYLKTEQFDKAMAMSDKLMRLALEKKDSLYLGKGYLYQSNLLRKQGLFKLSVEKVDRAITIFQQINDLRHLSHAWTIKSLTYDQNNDFSGVRYSLLNASRFAFESNDKHSELEALLTLAQSAFKFDETNESEHYMALSESKIRQYQMPQSYLANIPFLRSGFTDKWEEKEKLLKETLSLAQSDLSSPIAQLSRYELVLLYLKKHEIEKASNIIESAEAPSESAQYLQALLKLASGDESGAIQYALKAFESAELQGKIIEALNAASLLVFLSIDTDFYKLFIERHASPQWHKNNEKLLHSIVY